MSLSADAPSFIKMLKEETCVVERFLLKNNYGNRIIPTQLSQPSGDFFFKDN